MCTKQNRSLKSERVQHSYTSKWIYHETVHVDLMEGNVIQINGGIMINVGVRVKNVMYMKKIMFGILLHVIPKMENI